MSDEYDEHDVPVSSVVAANLDSLNDAELAEIGEIVAVEQAARAARRRAQVRKPAKSIRRVSALRRFIGRTLLLIFGGLQCRACKLPIALGFRSAALTTAMLPEGAVCPHCGVWFRGFSDRGYFGID